MKLTHPDTPALIINVAPDHADNYRAQGWIDAPTATTDRASGKSGTAPRITTKKEKA